MQTLIILLITVITLTSVAVAQSKKDKLEIGVQSTLADAFSPRVPGRRNEGWSWWQGYYNINRPSRQRAEINFFPLASSLVFRKAATCFRDSSAGRLGNALIDGVCSAKPDPDSSASVESYKIGWYPGRAAAYF
jgi:hypothetical protein